MQSVFVLAIVNVKVIVIVQLCCYGSPHLLHNYLEIAEEEAGDEEAGLYGGEGAVFQGVAGDYLHGFQFIFP